MAGSCVAAVNFVNNLGSSVTITFSGAYQIWYTNFQNNDVNGQYWSVVPAGQSTQITVTAAQGGDYPSDDSGTLTVTINDTNETFTVTWVGQGTDSGFAPLMSLWWTINPNNQNVQAGVGALLNTSFGVDIINDISDALGEVTDTDGLLGSDATEYVAEGMGEVLAEAAEVIGPILAEAAIAYLIISEESNVALSGATTITFNPNSN